MEIIHWIAVATAELRLFDDHETMTNYGQREGDRLQTTLVETTPPTNLLPTVNLGQLREVNESVLPHRAVIRAHLDVYDATMNDHCPPYRITRATDMDSMEYHRSVYRNIQGAEKTINVNGGYDFQDLFLARKEQGWRGTDSLYQAWLLVNYGLVHPLFSIPNFTKRFPRWREVKLKSMDLSPTLQPSGRKLDSDSSFLNLISHIKPINLLYHYTHLVNHFV